MKTQKGPPIADLVSLFGTQSTIKRLRSGVEQTLSIKQSSKSQIQ